MNKHTNLNSIDPYLKLPIEQASQTTKNSPHMSERRAKSRHQTYLCSHHHDGTNLKGQSRPWYANACNKLQRDECISPRTFFHVSKQVVSPGLPQLAERRPVPPVRTSEQKEEKGKRGSPPERRVSGETRERAGEASLASPYNQISQNERGHLPSCGTCLARHSTMDFARAARGRRPTPKKTILKEASHPHVAGLHRAGVTRWASLPCVR